MAQKKFGGLTEKTRFGLHTDTVSELSNIRALERVGNKKKEFTDCPKCHSKNTQVVDSRKAVASLRRRRCLDCNYRWTTYEITEADFKDLRTGGVMKEFETEFHALIKKYLHSLDETERDELIEDFYS